MKKIFVLFLFLLTVRLHAEIDVPADFGLEDFLTGKELKMKHNFKNNILAVGNKLKFTGTSFEDVVLFGMNIDFNGYSRKDVYIAGDTVAVSGNIKGNLRIIARNLQMDNLVVEGNLNILSPEILISDSVRTNKTTKIWSRNIQMGGTHNILYIKTRHIVFTKNIDINSKLVVQSKEKPAIPLNVLDRCDFSYISPAPFGHGLLSSKFIKLYSFLSLCFPFILMIVFTPRILQETIEIIEKKPVWIFFTGLLLLIVVPIILIFLMITVIGAPLGLIFLTFYLSLLYLYQKAI